MEDLANKVDGDQINGGEWIQQPQEIQNLITDSGQTLNGGDLRQLAKATAIVVNSKAQANAIPIIENGRKVFITSSDGGEFTMRTGQPVGTYNDDGGILTGTKFTNGDGSSGFDRDTHGVINSKWFENGTVTSIEGVEINPVSVKKYYNGVLATETISNGIKVGATGGLEITNSGVTNIINKAGDFTIWQQANGVDMNFYSNDGAGVFKLGISVGGNADVVVKLRANAVVQAETVVGAFNVVNKLQIGGVDVTVGAVDSGGAGFRVLRIPN